MPTNPAWPNDSRPVSPVSRLMLNTARLKISAVITMLIQNVPNVSGSAARTATAAIIRIRQSHLLRSFPRKRESSSLLRTGSPLSRGRAGSRSDILIDPLRHEAARKEDEREHQQGERDRGRIGVRDVHRADALDHADQQRAEDRAVHIA